ncbi:hypothetical protein [Novipirellula sp.]
MFLPVTGRQFAPPLNSASIAVAATAATAVLPFLKPHAYAWG